MAKNLYPPTLSERDDKLIKQYRRPPLPKKSSQRKLSFKDKTDRIDKMRKLYGMQSIPQNLSTKPPTLTLPNLQKLNDTTTNHDIGRVSPLGYKKPVVVIKNSPTKAHEIEEIKENKFNNPAIKIFPPKEGWPEIAEEILEKDAEGLIEWAKDLPEEISSTFKLKI